MIVNFLYLLSTKKRINPHDYCDFHQLSDGIVSYYLAKNMLDDKVFEDYVGTNNFTELDQLQGMIYELDRAINLGLPIDLGIDARFTRVLLLFQKVGLLENNLEENQVHGFILDAINDIEHVISIDSKEKCGYFIKPINYSRLILLNNSYLAIVKKIESKNEIIKYLENKVELFDYLPLCPLPDVLVLLGILYEKAGNIERSKYYFQKAISLAPVDNGHEEWNPRVKAARERAQSSLTS